MSTTHPEVLVLWAERFDEAATVRFVTAFRKAGLRTKLVSLGSRPSAGAHGLVLMADWTLEEALSRARGVRCVVVPAPGAGFQRVTNDPRVEALLGWLSTQDPLLIVGPLEARPMAQRMGLSFVDWGDDEARDQIIQRVISYMAATSSAPGEKRDRSEETDTVSPWNGKKSEDRG